MVMTMLEAALWYAERGLAVFPCSPGTKIPFAGTSGCKDATTDEAVIRSWWEKTPTANVAIATGSASGIYVVDIDAASSEIMPRLPETWIARTRGGGWHYVYRLPDGVKLPNTAKKAPNAISPDADTRGEGGYIVAFPSEVEGGTYQWVNDIDPAMLPQWVIERVRPRQQAITLTRQTFSMASTTWAERALREEIDGLARTGEGGRNHAIVRAAFKLGQICAAGHLSFGVAHDELVSVVQGWPSLRKSLATIRRGLEGGAKHPRSPADRPVAIDGGYYLDEVIDAIEVSDDGTPDEVMAPERKRPERPTPAAMDEARWALLNDVRRLGGLCDTFCGWVIRGADHPQPGLTIGALLALGSAVAGRRLVYRRSTSSLYVVSMASSGEGKNRPQSCLSRVIDEVWPALRGANSFSSGPAFTDGVRKATSAGTATCLVLDEYGMQLGNMMGPRAASHRQDIKQSLTELSTKGTDKWSPAVSLVKGGGKLDLIAPVVTILGSTTPDSLHSVLTSTDVADGFVGRHVWMRSQHVLPEWQPPETRPEDDLPLDVRRAVMAIRESHEAWHMALPVTLDTGVDVLRLYDPITMGEEPEARDRLTDCKVRADKARRDGSRAEIPPAVLARMPEFAGRLAMVLAVLAAPEDDRPVVTDETARVAIALAEESAAVFAASLSANRRASWDDHAAQCDLVLGAIRGEGGSMGRSDLLRACRALSSRQMEEIIRRLVDEGTVVVQKEATGGRPREVYALRTD
jgi:hypothetical protein